MRRVLAVWLGKILTVVGKLAGKKSSSAPGEIAMKIYPNLLHEMPKHVRKGIIVTCGTNGKTTTNNVVCSVLEGKGHKVLCNRVGANMLTGIATIITQEANLLGSYMVDYACLEIDEAYARIVFDQIKPDVMIMTNLFRDQLDRYGEIDTTSKFIREAILKVPGIKLVLNADDPLCVQFGNEKNAKAYYYGISEKILPQIDDTKDGKFCVMCGAPQEYNYYHYSQLGDFYCSNCGFKRPKVDFDVTNVSLVNGIKFDINGQTVEVKYKGFYNIYNFAAVYGALEVIGENTDNFSNMLKEYKPQIGRMQEFNLKKPVILSLSKNPAGFNQAISTVNADTRKKDVIIAVNDAASDGRDISWIWDVDFDEIKDKNLNLLEITGTRKWDMGLRFKYADINVDFITDSMKEAIEKSLKSNAEVCYIIVNYTALFSTEAILNEMVKKMGGNVQ